MVNGQIPISKMHYLWAQEYIILKLKWMYICKNCMNVFWYWGAKIIFYKKDDHLPQTVGNIYLRKGAKIMLYKKKDGYSEVTRY